MNGDSLDTRLRSKWHGSAEEKTPGRPTGADRVPSPEQEKRVQQPITDKTPDRLKMAYALWTREEEANANSQAICLSGRNRIHPPGRGSVVRQPTHCL